MIRTAIIAIFLSIYVLILGPPLILYTLVTHSAELMYWVGVKGLVFITRVAGLRVRVEGLENIPAGVCLFAANRHARFTRLPVLISLQTFIIFLLTFCKTGLTTGRPHWPWL